jgi:hypothetical protein
VRRAIAVAAALGVLALSGCAAEAVDRVAALRCHQPDDQASHTLVLMAQAVPTASALPCLEAVPADWAIHDFSARRGEARFELTYLEMGSQNPRGVHVRMTRRCDLDGAREGPSDRPGMRRYDLQKRDGSAYSDKRFYQYPGACVEYHFDLRGTGANDQATDVSKALGFVPRDTIRRQIREMTDGRLELDPSDAP